MRKIMEAIGLGLLVILFWMTYDALNGPNPLPGRIPTHFDAAGNANAWGPPSTLMLLPIVAAGVYLLITALSQLHSAINLPVRVTPQTRGQIEALTLQMVAWFKAELVCLFTWLQWTIIQTVRNGGGSISPALVPVFLVVVFATLIAHMVAIVRVARAGPGLGS